MMKKLICVILTLALLLGTMPALAATLDLSYVDRIDAISLSVDEERGIAFIDCGDSITVADRSFEHAYEHPNLYSYIYTDILICNYGTEDAYPVLRTWIEYRGTKYIYATSATFVIDDAEYTLSDLEDADWISENDGGVQETLMIKYGTENVSFITALLKFAQTHFDAGEYDITIPVTLHGTEDLSFEMDAWVILDFEFIADAFSEINGIDYFNLIEGASPLKVK